jgi:hypothetical protein
MSNCTVLRMNRSACYIGNDKCLAEINTGISTCKRNNLRIEISVVISVKTKDTFYLLVFRALC